MADKAELVVPELGESITEAVIGRWLKSVGDSVSADEPVVDLETDKITVQLPAPVSGALREQRYAEGDTVKVGDVVGEIEEGAAGEASAAADEPAEPAEEPAEPAEEPEAKTAGEPDEAAAGTADSAEEPAEETSADVDAVGPDGRKLSPSQRRAARNGESVGAAPAAEARTEAPKPAPAPAPAPAAEVGPREEVVKMSSLRKRIAERLVEAQQSSASLTTFNEVDMTAVIAARKQNQDAFVDRHGIKLGFMSFFVKAAVSALKLYPGLNAEIRDDSIVYKKFYDIGIAVSTDRGLVVPVLRNCDQLGFAEIEHGIVDLATRARDGKLQLSDLQGASFTITNGGIFGSMMSTPLLNYPQTGILGMHNIVKRPVAVGDSVEVRPVMYVAVTYDHRVVDGKESVQFLVALKERVENPDRLLYDL
jgi:2-oxoglutarate dehydrogenase E2 component (dihydrolipoamide succinyltransferase)